MNLKIKDFVEQIDALRQENQQKTDLANKLVHKLALTEKERDEFASKYAEYKNENKSLKRNFRQVQIFYYFFNKLTINYQDR